MTGYKKHLAVTEKYRFNRHIGLRRTLAVIIIVNLL